MLRCRRTAKLSSFLIQCICMLQLASAFFTGTITPDDDQIQKVDRKYTFNLSHNTAITDPNSKLVVRFPTDFEDQFSISRCDAISGFGASENGQTLDCEYNSRVRILSIFFQQPPDQTLTELKFSVTGVTNPRVAATTGFFTVDSYVKKQNGQWDALENSDGSLKMKFEAGSISAASLDLSVSVVGVYSDLTVSYVTEHDIPISNGQIDVEFPKWNPNAPVDKYKSYVDTATTSVTVPCQAQLGFPSDTSLECVFITGATRDTLSVYFSDAVNTRIAAGQQRFVVTGIRGPPTTRAVQGFAIRTGLKQNDGVLNGIDESTQAITLKVDAPEPVRSSNMAITADFYSIFTVSTLTFKVLTVNPLDQFSSIEFVLPDEFTVDGVNAVAVKTLSSTKDSVQSCDDASSSSASCYEWNASQRRLKVVRFNQEYIPSQTNIYIEVGKVENPQTAGASSTFTYLLSDQEGNPIEQATEGIFFFTTAGGFMEIEVSVPDDKKTINEREVPFTFRMKPENAFTSSALIKITLPAQLFVDQPVVQIGQSLTSMRYLVASQIDVQFNRIIQISPSFTLNSRGDEFYLTISGFVNPPTTQQTDAFEVTIYESSSQLDIVVQSDRNSASLKFQADPSFDLEIDAQMSETQTGDAQTKFVISGSLTSDNHTIGKQSYLKVLIPSQFTFDKEERVAATCTSITGFSDEISCSFDNSERNKRYLVVTNGFDSQDFKATTFSFWIAELRNPLNTKPTDSFVMQILDKTGGIMYKSQNTLQLSAEPSNFAFVHVESNSAVNGETQTTYTVTVTLGVNTPNKSWLELIPPAQIKFEDGLFLNQGTQNLVQSLDYENNEAGGRIILLSGTNSDEKEFPSGTTIQLQVGFLTNAMSLQSSDPFKLATFIYDEADLQANAPVKRIYKINENTDSIIVTNSVPGPVSIKSFEQFETEELGASTKLKVTFNTRSPIPQSASMTLTLPAILTVDEAAEFRLNGEAIPGRIINSIARQFKLNSMPSDQETEFTVEITSGLTNPSKGPYSLNYLQIEFQNSEGFSIDKVTSQDELKVVKCLANCGTCTGDRSTCTSCPIGFYLKGTECLKDCGSGFYSVLGKQYCAQCDAKCLECRVSAYSCTLCNPDVVPATPYADPMTLQCYSECPSGTYLDNGLKQCLRCESPCYTCSSKDTCLSCDRTDESNSLIFYLASRGKCYDECPNVSVPTPSKVCAECESPCETCENLTKNCLTCIEGHYLHTNNECVTSCPFLYIEDSESRSCKYFGEISVPIPFTIVAFVLTVGVGISAWVKGADRDGREQKGTAFFVTMLALVDMLLRINWAVLTWSVSSTDFYTTLGLLIAIQIISVLVNVFLWRRYFQNIYKYEETDPLFAAYVMKYPATANIIIFLSYLLTFQAVRLTYSRFLGKKMFMARFTRRLRYFRLIGRLTVFETLFIYLPAVSTNIYTLTVITQQKDSQYWLNVDSMILVLYAIVLISVVLTQREKLMNYQSFFKFKELFTFGDDADVDDLVDLDDHVAKALDSHAKNFTDGGEDQISVHSAFGHEDIAKMKMYQIEQRYRSLDDARGHKQIDGRVVSVTDFQEFRKLEDKRDRIMLKKTLYERKKVSDESQVVLLNEELNKYQRHKDELNNLIPQLKLQLKALQKKIVTVDKTRKKELYNVEQEKRRDIIRRAGREVPYQSHQGGTKATKAQQITAANAAAKNTTATKADPQNAEQTKKDRDSSLEARQNLHKQPLGKRRGRGGQRGQQVKSLSPEQTREIKTQADEVVYQQSPTMFADPPRQASNAAANNELLQEDEQAAVNGGNRSAPDSNPGSFGVSGSGGVRHKQEEDPSDWKKDNEDGDEE